VHERAFACGLRWRASRTALGAGGRGHEQQRETGDEEGTKGAHAPIDDTALAALSAWLSVASTAAAVYAVR
jgi:hypothetical protein